MSTKKILPKPGDVFTKGGRDRVVVSITYQGDNPNDCFVEWRRPVSDMRSWSMWLPSWIRWAESAEYKTIPVETAT